MSVSKFFNKKLSENDNAIRDSIVNEKLDRERIDKIEEYLTQQSPVVEAMRLMFCRGLFGRLKWLLKGK